MLQVRGLVDPPSLFKLLVSLPGQQPLVCQAFHAEPSILPDMSAIMRVFLLSLVVLCVHAQSVGQKLENHEIKYETLQAETRQLTEGFRKIQHEMAKIQVHSHIF